MPNLKKLILLPMLLFVWGMAQADDVFNPSNPPEPNATYRLAVSATPAGAANVSGKGLYTAGTRVYVNTSAASVDYGFKHWLKDGEIYSTSRSFYYTMGTTDVEFVAVYEYIVFDPTSPGDPGANYKWRLNLVSEPQEASSFNINSGTKFEQGSSVAVRTYANAGFEFLGWYKDGALISSDKNYTLTMPSSETTLVARYTFNPDSPGDPTGSTSGVDNPQFTQGDVNNDGSFSVLDATMAIGYVLNEAPVGANRTAADMNHDGEITVLDIALIIEKILNANN